MISTGSGSTGSAGGSAARPRAWCWRGRSSRSPSNASATRASINMVMPETYFVGADVSYEFLQINNLVRYLNQKYKSMEEIPGGLPGGAGRVCAGNLPGRRDRAPASCWATRRGGSRSSFRSSGRFEDNFGLSFAGMYDSIFCPNQGTVEENLEFLLGAICGSTPVSTTRTCCSIASSRRCSTSTSVWPSCCRSSRASRTACLLPLAAKGDTAATLSGTPSCGMRTALRIVVGLGAQAVDRVGEDYPRMVALNHPTLRPRTAPATSSTTHSTSWTSSI